MQTERQPGFAHGGAGRAFFGLQSLFRLLICGTLALRVAYARDTVATGRAADKVVGFCILLGAIYILALAPPSVALLGPRWGLSKFQEFRDRWGAYLVVCDVGAFTLFSVIIGAPSADLFLLLLLALTTGLASLQWKPSLITLGVCVAGLVAASVATAIISQTETVTRRELWYSAGYVLLGRSLVLSVVTVTSGCLLGHAKELEAGLAEAEERYDTLLQAMPQCVVIKDREKRFIRVNASFCKFVGRTESQILGKSDLDFFILEHATEFRKDDDFVLSGKFPELTKEEEENCIRGGKLDGTKRYASVKKVPIRNAAGDLVGIQVMFFDETKERKEKHRLLRFFLHDAPKPLILIRDKSLARLTEGLRGGDGVLVKECTRIGKNIELLLANFDAYGFVGKSGTYTWKWESDGIDCCLEDVVDIVLMGATPNRDEVKFLRQQFRKTENRMMRSDKYKLIAMGNLLVDNAVKALDRADAKRDKCVKLDLFIDGDTLYLRVEDTGCGIPKDDLEKVYDDGFTTFGSSGLGLHIVRGFAELAGGRVACESAVGQGTIFSVEIKKFKLL